MRTDFPTTELYFVFAFTFCKLTVYTDQEPFARKILEAKDVEFLESSESYDWQEWDTRLLLAIVSETLPNMICSLTAWSMTRRFFLLAVWDDVGTALVLRNL